MATKNKSQENEKQKIRRKKKKYIFYPIYWSLVLLCVGAIVLMMRVLWDNMADYEASMPKYAAQDVEQIFLKRDFETMYQNDTAVLSYNVNMQDYVAYMNTLTDGYEITCKESFSVNSDEKLYQIKFGANKLATFTLHKSGEKTEFGNDLWALKEIKSSVITTKDYFITVPESSVVYADGHLLSEDQVVESGLELSEGYRPAGCEHDKWQTYMVTRCFNAPRFEVKDAKNRPQSIFPNQEGRLTVNVNYDDDELRTQVEDRVVEVAEAFAKFTSDDYHAEHLIRYHAIEGSKAAQYIKAFDGGWFMNHRDVEFLNMRTEQYVQYGENRFSCEVRFDYKITYSRNRTETYPTGYIFFFEKQNDEWRLFDFSTVE